METLKSPSETFSLDKIQKSLLETFSNVLNPSKSKSNTSKISESVSKSVNEVFDGSLNNDNVSKSSPIDVMYQSMNTAKDATKNTINLATNTVSSMAAPAVSAASAATAAVTSASSTSSSMSFWKLFKISLLIFIIVLLSVNLYSFYFHGQDALTYYLGDLFGDFNEPSNTENANLSNADQKENKIPHPDKDVEDGNAETAVDLAAEKVSNIEKIIPTKLNKALNDNNKNTLDGEGKNYKANNLSVNVNKKAGFCYLGKDRGVRTCVEVDGDDTCMSNQIYPTMDKCVNPNLKE